ncbi:MAG: hypothetical protein SNJ55_10665 [Chloroherpetonaceae bacterium]
MSQATQSKSYTFQLIVGWSIVGIPSLWAIWQVIVKTIVLFQ